MDDSMLALVQEIHRKAAAQREVDRLLPSQTPAIPFDQLPELPCEHELHREWNTYRREVGTLLATSCRGLYVLVKGDSVLGVYGRADWAYIAALEMMLMQQLTPPFLIHRVCETEQPSCLEELKSLWPRSRIPLMKTA